MHTFFTCIQPNRGKLDPNCNTSDRAYTAGAANPMH